MATRARYVKKPRMTRRSNVSIMAGPLGALVSVSKTGGAFVIDEVFTRERDGEGTDT